MRVWRPNLSVHHEHAAVEPERRKRARLRGHVQSAPLRVPGENVRVVRDLQLLNGLHGPQIEYDQSGVTLAGDEGKSIRLVDDEAMGMIRSRQIIPLHDLFGDGIDR